MIRAVVEDLAELHAYVDALARLPRWRRWLLWKVKLDGVPRIGAWLVDTLQGETFDRWWIFYLGYHEKRIMDVFRAEMESSEYPIRHEWAL